ncbi:uncharacterized protein [Argopecten irradians]|uniref:uncharacterized protein n=1 Tax=Argopecten irradians TaxID=31199 RepID=UPI0037138854
MYKVTGLVFFGCLTLGYGLLFGDSPMGMLAMSGMGGGGGMGGADPFSSLFGNFGGGMAPPPPTAGVAAPPAMGAAPAAAPAMGATAGGMDPMFHALSRMTLCGETPSRIRYKTRGSCNPYECNRMATGHDVACLGHSCCCKTFHCTVMLDA